MKKLVSLIQMVVLVAMLPVYMVIELSHEKVKSPVSTPASAIEKMTEKSSTQFTQADAEVLSSVLTIK
jgi:hypothetical protein